MTPEERALHSQLITSSWCGLLAALTPLIDAATDESATENVLKAMQNYASLCGTLGKLQCFLLHCKGAKNMNANRRYQKYPTFIHKYIFIPFIELQAPRDAFITAICKSSLPPHYALSVLNMGYQFSGVIGKRNFTIDFQLGSTFIGVISLSCSSRSIAKSGYVESVHRRLR